MTSRPRRVHASLSRSPLAVALALRYLKSSRRDSFVSFLSTFASGGLALGVAALILALSALSGFQGALRTEVMERTPELAIDVASREDLPQVLEMLNQFPEIQSAQLTNTGAGWIAFEGSVRPVEMLGYDGDLPGIYPGPTSRESGLYIPAALAETWVLGRGDIVEVASSRPTLTPLGPQPRTVRLRVAGTFAAGATEQRTRIALPLESVEALVGRRGYRLVASTGDLVRSQAVAGALRARLGARASVSSWQDLNRPLFFALRLEKTLMFVAVFLIVVVAALALVSNVHLIVASKRREIGILGAMGASDRLVLRTFVYLGAGLGAAGVAVGAAVGLLAAWVLGAYRLIRLPASVYFLDHVPFSIVPLDIVRIVVLALLTAITAAWLGARAAVALRPAEVLHS